MKRFLVSIFCLLILACVGEKSDLEKFVSHIQSENLAHPPSLEPAPEFKLFSYQADLLRSPFVPPSRELTQEVSDLNQDCLQPNFQRKKGRLETYGLDTMKMRGTVSDTGDIWALVEALDGHVYRLGKGEYLGLYHGKIKQVSQRHIEIVEMIRDASGCWTERPSKMELTGN